MHLNSNLISASHPVNPSPTPIVEKQLGEKLLNFGTESNLIDATNSTIVFFLEHYNSSHNCLYCCFRN